MRYTEEEKIRLLSKLKELLQESDQSIKAVFVSDRCVYTCSDRSNMTDVHRLMYKVGEEFGIDEDELGGFTVRNIEVLREAGGYFYAERN